MIRAAIFLCTVAGLLVSPLGRQAPATPTFTLYLLGHAIGREIVTSTTAGPTRTTTFDFSYDDRGTNVVLAGTLEQEGQAVTSMSVKGRTYRYFSTDVTVRGDARVTTPMFPIDSFAPIGLQELLIQYWLERSRPAVIAAAPAGDVRITQRADDGRWLRLAIDGPVWGRETAWVAKDTRQLIALTSWAGGLPFEAVRSGYEDQRGRFIREAVADRMADLAAMTRAVAPAQSGTFALTGATVITGTTRPPLANATVLIRDGRIAAVGAAAAVAVPRGVPVLDAAGRFIIPGLWDMHAHVGQIDWGPTYLASGVTTIRDMGGEFEFLTAFRDAIAGGGLGPRLLLAGLVDGPGPRAFGAVTAATPEEGIAVVRRYHAAGFQQIKIYTLVTLDTMRAIIAEAHGLGMTVTGHVPNAMTASSVVEAGFDSLAHLQLRAPQADEQIALFKQRETVLDPTQSWNEFLTRSPALTLSMIHPDIERLPLPLARMLAGVTTAAGDPAAIRARLLESLRLVERAVAAGVPVVAGTDKGIPGFSLQRELELYVDGGMTPLQALQAATIVPARAMRLDKDTGTIEVGKRADLVLLTANPLDRISNVRTAARVVVNGRLYDCADLWRAAGFAAR